MQKHFIHGYMVNMDSCLCTHASTFYLLYTHPTYVASPTVQQISCSCSCSLPSRVSFELLAAHLRSLRAFSWGISALRSQLRVRCAGIWLTFWFQLCSLASLCHDFVRAGIPLSPAGPPSRGRPGSSHTFCWLKAATTQTYPASR